MREETRSLEHTYKGTLKSLIALSIPTIVEQMLSTLLQYVDTAMVGKLGEKATASVSVTTTVTWLVNSIPGAIGVAILAMIAKAVGCKDEKQIKGISMQAIFLVVVCGILTGGVSLFLSPFIPGWMGAEQGIQKQAAIYFALVSAPMLFRCCTIIFGASIRATRDTKTPMRINLLANILNVALNYVLIYVAGFGVTGAGIATAISYTTSGCLMLRAYKRNKLLYWKRKDFFIDREILSRCATISIPVLGTNVASCLGYVVFAGLVSSGMGTTIFAAHSIAVTAETIFYIPGHGLQTATSTMVGNALGEQNKRKFEMVSKLSIGITILMMCISGVILYFVAEPLMSLFTPNKEVVRVGASMLRLVSCSEPFFGLMIVLEGIFYGLGRTRYALFVEIFSKWGIRIFFTFLCVRVWNFGLREVWYCMIADNVCKAILFSIPFLFRKSRERMFCLEKDKTK